MVWPEIITSQNRHFLPIGSFFFRHLTRRVLPSWTDVVIPWPDRPARYHRPLAFAQRRFRWPWMAKCRGSQGWRERPAAFRRQYTHHGTGINPKSMHTSDVETEGVEWKSPAPGRFVLRRDSDEDLAPSRDSAMSIQISDDSMAGATEIDEVAKKNVFQLNPSVRPRLIR